MTLEEGSASPSAPSSASSSGGSGSSRTISNDSGSNFSSSSNSSADAGMLKGFQKGTRAFSLLPPHAKWMMAGYITVWLTILSPSGLLTAWLAAEGVQTSTIASFRSASQLAGCIGTVIFCHPSIQRHYILDFGFLSRGFST
jgi:hypothetical protein